MDIRVIKKEAFEVVGMAWNGTYEQTEQVKELFTEMESRVAEVFCRTSDAVLIAPFHSRETEFTYYVTVPVSEIMEVPSGMVGFAIPEKSYVLGSHRGSGDTVRETYIQMFDWMKEYGYDLDDHALSLEIYERKIDELVQNGDELAFEIYLPIKQHT